MELQGRQSHLRAGLPGEEQPDGELGGDREPVDPGWNSRVLRWSVRRRDRISNAAFCWVKDVQTDQTIGGMHIRLGAAYRCVVRDSYFHHSKNYGFGTDCYGIVLGCFSADNLIENNIARYMNKPILLIVRGAATSSATTTQTTRGLTTPGRK